MSSLSASSTSRRGWVGTSTHLVIRMATQGFSLKWAWMLGSSPESTSKIRLRDFTKNPWSGSGSHFRSLSATASLYSPIHCKTTTVSQGDSNMMNVVMIIPQPLLTRNMKLSTLMQGHSKCGHTSSTCQCTTKATTSLFHGETISLTVTPTSRLSPPTSLSPTSMQSTMMLLYCTPLPLSTLTP